MSKIYIENKENLWDDEYMKYITQKSIVLFILGFVLMPLFAFAHQPRIMQSQETNVIDSEISKAYYATLTGSPHVYTIESKEAFDLYVGILVPDIESTKKDILAEVFKDGVEIATLGGESVAWKPYFETFGQSHYFDGGEYKARAEAGVYTITVSNPDNTGKYSLAIGEIEAFDMKETLNALTLVPQLKKDFFNESPIGFILSPMGWGLIVIMYILAFLFGFVAKFSIKALQKKRALTSLVTLPKNIGTPDRLVRLVLGLGLLFLAMLTTWNPLLIFISGVVVFQAVFSWCFMYQIMGKNTCPVE
jgi:hypothetical protein